MIDTNSATKENSICIIGTNNNVSSQFRLKGYNVSQYGRNTDPEIDFNSTKTNEMIKLIVDSQIGNKYIILSGFLQSKKILNQTKDEIINSIFVNSIGPTLFSEYLLNTNPNARLIIIGSESGYKGSYDLTYALSKSSLRMYVKQKRTKPNQQLLLISPSTIIDFGMTERRLDIQKLNQYRINHPKKRFLNSIELTDLIINLFSSTNYLSNEEINLNGGKFSLMY